MTTKLYLSLSGLLALCLTGCGIQTNLPAATAGAAIKGTVHGGQQPVVGARLYLLAAATTGYGSASTSLLTTGIAGTDSIGGYVLSGPGGSFSLGGAYVCQPGQQVYLLALGGDPTGASVPVYNNTAIGMMAALGNCPSAGTLALRLPFVSINELTTVAAAYALSGFAVDATHIASSGTTQAATGVANAFLTAANLVDPVSGASYATTPGGSGTAPRAEINTLGNILSACVNTTQNTSTNCTQLFDLLRAGGTTGALPSETASVAINLAHHPGANTSALYALAPGTAAPFQPSLASVPNDFSVGIIFPFTPQGAAFDSAGNLWGSAGQGVLEFSNAGNLLSPATGYTGGGVTMGGTAGASDVAVDPSDNVWATTLNSTVTPVSFNNALSKFSNTGVALSPAAGFTGGGLNQPQRLAIDGQGNVWAGNTTGATVSKLSSAGVGAAGSPFTTSGQANASNLAIDSLGELWVGSVTTSGTQTSSLSVLSNSGGLLRIPVPSTSALYPGLSIDSANNLWAQTYYQGTNGNQIIKLTQAGVAASGFPITGNAAVRQCLRSQIDGDGNFWCASDADSIAEVSPSGASLSPAAGYVVPLVSGPQQLAIDSSGNVWTFGNYTFNNSSFASVTIELIGAAAPVITPYSLAIQLGKLGSRP